MNDTKLKRALLWFSFGILVLIAVLSGAKAMKAADLCTDAGWYQRSGDRIWVFANPEKAGTCQQGGTGAHTYSCYGESGGYYQIIDNCYACTGSQGTWRRPDDPVAGPIWDCFYTEPCPDSDGVPREPEWRRHVEAHYYNDSFLIPNGAQHYDFVTMIHVPDPPRATLARAYGCLWAGTPVPITPHATATRAPSPARTATRHPTLPPSPGGCPGGVPCTTKAPSPTLTAAPPTRRPTSTLVPSTPVPVNTVRPPSTVSPSPTTTASGTPSTTGSPTPTSTPTPDKGCWFCGCKSK